MSTINIARTAQDAVCAYRRFAGDPEQLFFGVFDGHGQLGTSCAQFAKDQVPANLLSSQQLSASPVEAFRAAMTLCNQQLHTCAIDDSMSGTTAITCLIRGRRLYVANVGDSRFRHTLVSQQLNMASASPMWPVCCIPDNAWLAQGRPGRVCQRGGCSAPPVDRPHALPVRS